MPQTSTGVASTSILATCQVPDAGDLVTGAGFKAAIDPLNNDLATIKSGNHPFAGNKSFSGTVLFTGTITTADANLNGVTVMVRKRIWRARVGAPGTLADSSQTIKLTDGDRFNLNGAPVAARDITLDHTLGNPGVGETMTCFCVSTIEGTAATKMYTFKRENGTVVAEMWTSGASVDTRARWVEFEWYLVSSGPDVYGWRLGAHSGTEYDGAAACGILPINA